MVQNPTYWRAKKCDKIPLVPLVSRESRQACFSQLTTINRISGAWGEMQKRRLPRRPPSKQAPIEFPIAIPLAEIN